MKRLLSIYVIAYFILAFTSCKQLGEITRTLSDIKNLQFKLENVSNFELAGINIKQKSSVSDFSITEGLKLANLVRTKSLPVDFIINVAAKNPNDGTDGGKKATATLTKFDWKLYLDDVETINGEVNTPIEIPASGYTTNIPLRVSLDLFKFFGNRSYESIANLAMAIGGVNGSAAKVKLDIHPTVETSFGPISYPGRIVVIDKEFR